jgi:hypothetical protein
LEKRRNVKVGIRGKGRERRKGLRVGIRGKVTGSERGRGNG